MERLNKWGQGCLPKELLRRGLRNVHNEKYLLIRILNTPKLNSLVDPIVMGGSRNFGGHNGKSTHERQVSVCIRGVQWPV